MDKNADVLDVIILINIKKLENLLLKKPKKLIQMLLLKNYHLCQVLIKLFIQEDVVAKIYSAIENIVSASNLEYDVVIFVSV